MAFMWFPYRFGSKGWCFTKILRYVNKKYFAFFTGALSVSYIYILYEIYIYIYMYIYVYIYAYTYMYIYM